MLFSNFRCTFSFAKINELFFFLAICLIYSTPLLFKFIITGQFSFIIPAFSYAIFSIVSPNLSIWSRLKDVIIDRTFLFIIFVASNFPPKPVSITQISISLSSNELTFTLNGSNYVSNEITVNGGTLDNVQTTVGTVEKNGNKFKVVIPVSSVTSKTDLEVTTVVSKELDQARNYSCGSYQSVTPVKLETVKIDAEKKLKASIEPLGKLTINKYDNNNN